nr:MAG TPA: hypothetical protein [Caudoviricetes sp.]
MGLAPHYYITTFRVKLQYHKRGKIHIFLCVWGGA